MNYAVLISEWDIHVGREIVIILRGLGAENVMGYESPVRTMTDAHRDRLGRELESLPYRRQKSTQCRGHPFRTAAAMSLDTLFGI